MIMRCQNCVGLGKQYSAGDVTVTVSVVVLFTNYSDTHLHMTSVYFSCLIVIDSSEEIAYFFTFI